LSSMHTEPSSACAIAFGLRQGSDPHPARNKRAKIRPHITYSFLRNLYPAVYSIFPRDTFPRDFGNTTNRSCASRQASQCVCGNEYTVVGQASFIDLWVNAFGLRLTGQVGKQKHPSFWRELVPGGRTTGAPEGVSKTGSYHHTNYDRHIPSPPIHIWDRRVNTKTNDLPELGQKVP